MKKQLYIVFTILLSTLIWSEANAQQERNAYGDFLRLEFYLTRVENLLSRFNDPTANDLFSQARGKLEEARNSLYSSTPPRFGQARLQMAVSRNLADRAARLVLRRPFANLKSQLDDLINGAERAVTEYKSDEAYYLLNQAKKFRGLAYSSFLAGRLIRGQEYYRIAFFFGRKCMDYLSKEPQNLSEQVIELEYSIRQLLDQGRELLNESTNQNLLNLFQEAEQHFDEALQLIDEGKENIALNRLRLIKRLLYRIFDLAEKNEVGPGMQIENSLYSLKTLLEALQLEIEESAVPNARLLFEKATNLYQEAQRLFENQNYRLAQTKISLSQRLANRIFSMLSRNESVDVNNVQYQIEQTKQLQQLQLRQIDETGNESFKILHQEAAKLLAKSEQELQKNNLRGAFQLLQAATRMSARLQRLLKSAADSPDTQVLEEKYRRVLTLLNQMEANAQIKEENAFILSQWRQFADLSRQYIDQGELLLAEEYLNTLLEQIKNYTNKWRQKPVSE